MEHVNELLIGLVMLLTMVGTIAIFITFYKDEASTEGSGPAGRKAGK